MEGQPVGTKPKSRKGRQRLLSCLSVFLGVVFVMIILSLVFLVVFYNRYEHWRSDNEVLLDEMVVKDVEDYQSVQRELYDILEGFSGSSIQREVMTLDCDMVNVLVEDVAKENWEVSRKDVGVKCGERSLDVYVKAGGMWWIVVQVWQRSEGDVDFAVYDVNLGPFSLAGMTLGKVSGEVTKGVKDAIDLISSESYSGRKIEEIYLKTEGIRVVGVLIEDDAEDEKGVDTDEEHSYNHHLAIDFCEC